MARALLMRDAYAAILLFGTVLVSENHLQAEQNTLSEAEKKAGWKLLFDGKTTKGWRNYKKASISDGWQVKAGALTRARNGAGDIITTDQYDNFELQIDFKISEEGNSGIMFHVTEESGSPWHTGPELQVLDNKKGHDPQKAGWLYQLYKSSVDACKPAGQWNTIHLRISPQQCETNMNGVRYYRFQIGSKDWNERVAKSKFSKYPNFGKAGKGHICLQDHGNLVSYRNIKIRPIKTGEQAINPVDGELPVLGVPAFKNLKWTGWNPVNDDGKAIPLRPIVLTHAGDGTNRIFVATQRGVIHTFANNDQARQTKVFLDITDRVIYSDKQNEEGFLGLTFHPDYKTNGGFVVYYTSKAEPQTSIISKFTVSADDPNKADPDSEVILLKIKQPYWNHNGGTVEFGPDGYLYIGLGDGGSANDPKGNGQNRNTLLGSILRIDVDHKSDGMNYAIPADNPFVNVKDVRPEIWAYGFRNVWRLAFDRKTEELWAADVGQNLWEEINIVKKGGNYGWNLREGQHAFGTEGVGPQDDLIDPIWEYDHTVGKSITGGVVYRGKAIENPKIQGAYIYADYVSGLLWALQYDRDQQKVLGNYALVSKKIPIISFGEDEHGEVYYTVVTPNGQGLFRLQPADK